MSCLKYFLISANLVGALAAAAGFLVGFIKPNILASSLVSGPQIVIVSSIVFAFALFGILATLRKSYWLLTTYGLAIIGQFILRLLWYASSYWIKSEYFIIDVTAASTIMSVILGLVLMTAAFLYAHGLRCGPDRRISLVSERGDKELGVDRI